MIIRDLIGKLMKVFIIVSKPILKGRSCKGGRSIRRRTRKIDAIRRKQKIGIIIETRAGKVRIHVK